MHLYCLLSTVYCGSPGEEVRARGLTQAVIVPVEDQQRQTHTGQAGVQSLQAPGVKTIC